MNSFSGARNVEDDRFVILISYPSNMFHYIKINRLPLIKLSDEKKASNEGRMIIINDMLVILVMLTPETQKGVAGYLAPRHRAARQRAYRVWVDGHL